MIPRWKGSSEMLLFLNITLMRDEKDKVGVKSNFLWEINCQLFFFCRGTGKFPTPTAIKMRERHPCESPCICICCCNSCWDCGAWNEKGMCYLLTLDIHIHILQTYAYPETKILISVSRWPKYLRVSMKSHTYAEDWWHNKKIWRG